MRIIAVYNIKGGVGKTATAVNLAHLSARFGVRTLLWDLDPQGASSFYFRVRSEIKGGVKKLFRRQKPLDPHIRGTDYEGLDLLPADFSNRKLDLVLKGTDKPRKRLARLLDPLRPDYDTVWLDCSPGISLISEGVFCAADALVVPTMPTTLSMRTLEQLHDYLSREGPRRLRVLPFFCIVDRRKALHREVIERGSRAYEFLPTEIPYSSLIEKMGVQRAPVTAYAPGSEAARAYEQLWRDVMRASGSLLGWALPL